MKRLLMISCLATLIACNSADTGQKTETSSDSKTAIPTMPYTLDKPYKNWQPGDQQNALLVMNSLKAWENGDITKSMEAFADTVEVHFDNWAGKYSKDSLAKQFATFRNNLASVSIHMDDWESVIAEDKSEQWVTMWYKETSTDKMGKTDSVMFVTDAGIVNGKIAILNEAMRRFPAKN
ncbi:MAG: hypothetical protein SFU20_12905 [Chitinophagaceae bacterium]|nr:hypothetical protein [Chitinophagaceae bacterium]